MRKNCSLLLVLSAVCSNAYCQEDTSKTGKELSEIIVTGQYKPQSLKRSVYQVKVISRERIEKQAATKLQDVLNNELNIRFSQDLATAGSDITMMGMAGQNVKILLDGLPIIGRQGTSNEININQVDIHTIERIEIVEGPMSVMYGADALGGVINIITKKAGLASWSVNARLHEETVGDEYSLFKQGIHTQSTGATFRHKNWQAGGNISYNYFGGWKDTAVDRELLWHKKDQINGAAFLQYSRPTFNIRYRVDGLDEIISNPGNFSTHADPVSGNYLAQNQQYLSQRLMQQLQAAYTVNKKLSFTAQSSYSDYSRQVYSTTLNKANGAVRRNNAKSANSVINFTGFTFRTAATYQLNKVFSFQPGADINVDRGDGERLNTGVNGVDDYAFYFTSEITPNSWMSLKPGARFTKNSVYKAPAVIPSINTRFALTKKLDLRLSYANGFRSPSLRELYFNFIDASHTILGNPNLKAETSNSLNASLNWKKITPAKVVYNGVIGGFYNKVKNLIDYAQSITDPNVTTLANIANSTTAGTSLQTMAKYNNWNLAVGLSYTGFYNIYAEADKTLPTLQWSPEANSSISYHFSKPALNVNLFYKVTGKRPMFAIDANQNFVKVAYESYHMADLTINKKLFKHFTIDAGVRNLFDVDRIGSQLSTAGIHSSGAGRSIATGRAFFAGIGFDLSR